MTMTFYYFHPGCSMASHIALEESGLPFEPRPVRMADDEDRAALRAVNPRGAVPVLVVDGTSLTENVAILSYVARAAPDARLAPGDDFAWARCLSRLAWCTSAVHIAFRQSIRPERFSADPAAHEAIRAYGRDAFWSYLVEIDGVLQGSPWMMGDAFSIADTYPLVFYHWGRLGAFPLDELGAFTAFKDRMIERPAVRRVLEREGSPLLAARS